MDKKMINFKYLLLLLFMFLSIRSNSQELTKELKWIPHDSITETILQDTNQIVDWGMNIGGTYASFQSENIWIKDCNIFILMVNICFGSYCPFIYVFKEEDELWHLITETHANLSKQIEIEVDFNQEKIIFKTKSVQLGELTFETLKLNFDKSKQ